MPQPPDTPHPKRRRIEKSPPSDPPCLQNHPAEAGLPPMDLPQTPPPYAPSVRHEPLTPSSPLLIPSFFATLTPTTIVASAPNTPATSDIVMADIVMDGSSAGSG